MHINSDHKRSVALLVNPLSGKGKAIAICQLLMQKMESVQLAHTVFIENWPASFEGFTEVWIIGGDGTLNYFINHYPAIGLPLVIFKGGTGNDFAKRLYGNISPEEQFEKILTTTPQPVDMLICNEKYYINSLGIGFDGEVMHSIGAIRWLGGHFGYLVAVIRNIFSFREKEFLISTPDKKVQGKFLIINVNNSDCTGGGFRITPLAEINDGLADMVLCKPLTLLQRLRYLPVIEKGKHLDLPLISYQHLAEVVIECKQEVYAHADGELIRSDRFAIKVLPAQLQFLY